MSNTTDYNVISNTGDMRAECPCCKAHFTIHRRKVGRPTIVNPTLSIQDKRKIYQARYKAKKEEAERKSKEPKDTDSDSEFC